jgi:hypothetical protein
MSHHLGSPYLSDEAIRRREAYVRDRVRQAGCRDDRDAVSGRSVARWFVLVLIATVSVCALVTAGALAKNGPPPPDATPGAVGVGGVPLGGVEPAVAAGYRLEVVELTWAPGAHASRHFHPTALVTCVQEGALGFELRVGAATLTRGGTADAPGKPEPIAPHAAVVLQPRDCIAFDEFATHREHTGWNAGDGPLVLWEARLLKTGEPFTTYVDAQGHAGAVAPRATGGSQTAWLGSLRDGAGPGDGRRACRNRPAEPIGSGRDRSRIG